MHSQTVEESHLELSPVIAVQPVTMVYQMICVEWYLVKKEMLQWGDTAELLCCINVISRLLKEMTLYFHACQPLDVGELD